jgi:RHS repeat-associated protein
VGVLSGSTGALAYVEPDQIGTPRVAIDGTSNLPDWNWSPLNDPFGETQPQQSLNGSSFTLNLRMPGQSYDAESGLNYNYFRDYDPTTGRYIESDPIGLRGGISTYGYVGGSSLRASDRFGLESSLDGCFSSPNGVAACTEAGIITARNVRTAQEIIDGALTAYSLLHCHGNNNVFSEGGEGDEANAAAAGGTGASAGAGTGGAAAPPPGDDGEGNGVRNTEPSPALNDSPYNPDAVANRIRPDYEPNPAHDPYSPQFNPQKTPEPSDAASVYQNASRGGMGTWYGRGQGGWYRYFSDNAGGAHFSGIVPESQVPNLILKGY